VAWRHRRRSSLASGINSVASIGWWAGATGDDEVPPRRRERTEGGLSRPIA